MNLIVEKYKEYLPVLANTSVKNLKNLSFHSSEFGWLSLYYLKYYFYIETLSNKDLAHEKLKTKDLDKLLMINFEVNRRRDL